MVGLLILKQLENLSDERVVEACVQIPYFKPYAASSGLSESCLTYFRRRIGGDGVRKIIEISVAIHGDKAKEAEVVVDSTVQEKNITFPTEPWPGWKTPKSGAATSAKSNCSCETSASNLRVAGRANLFDLSGVYGPSPVFWSA